MKFRLFIAAAAFAVVAGCTAPDRSRETLVKAGFTQIDVGGYALFARSDNDQFSTGFEATNSNGLRVKGAVCCGWLKNCTIRF